MRIRSEGYSAKATKDTLGRGARLPLTLATPSNSKDTTGKKPTVGRPDPHVLERDQAGALDDDFDRLLPIKAAHVSLALPVPALKTLVADGGFKCEVVGSSDADTSHAVVIHLRFTKSNLEREIESLCEHNLLGGK